MLVLCLGVTFFLVNYCACLKDEAAITDIKNRFIRHAPYYNAYFYARLTHNLRNHHGTVPFNQVIVNKLNRYNRHSGVFVCPRSGYYVFTWTLMTNHKQWVISELVAGGAVKGKLIVDSDEGTEVDQQPCLYMSDEDNTFSLE
ncbi:uncharacterized protein LOC134256257 [Saccostrea cucullata]|uniref:uncharacterized protein LOC134256257 n=1 Tax=Saccostrea cuccullata TaxID=36930 RepID=UPI002ED5BF3F